MKKKNSSKTKKTKPCSNKIQCNNVPNAETRKAIEDIEAGIGLIRSESLEDLFKELGI